MEHLCLLVFPRNKNDETLIIKLDPKREMDVSTLFTSSGRDDRFIRIKDDIDGTVFLVNIDRTGTPEIHTHAEGECPFGDDAETNQQIARFMREGDDDED